jgi:hypothetical protein
LLSKGHQRFSNRTAPAVFNFWIVIDAPLIKANPQKCMCVKITDACLFNIKLFCFIQVVNLCVIPLDVQLLVSSLLSFILNILTLPFRLSFFLSFFFFFSSFC